jgi:hypothetical protein
VGLLLGFFLLVGRGTGGNATAAEAQLSRKVLYFSPKFRQDLPALEDLLCTGVADALPAGTV